jgi:ketosteroid isomerase-like protein
MSQAKVDVVRAIYAEWATGNLRAGGDLYDEDLLFIPRRAMPDARIYLAPEGVREFMRPWLEAMADVTLEAEEFIEAGDSVVVHVLQRGSGQESSLATEGRYYEIWTFRGDKVIRREHFDDRAAALKAVGLSD